MTAYLRVEAAAAVFGVSESTFRRYVMPHIPVAMIGQTPVFLREDLDAWHARAKAGGSGLPETADPTTPSASRTRRGRSASSAPVRAMLSRLRGSPKTSTSAA